MEQALKTGGEVLMLKGPKPLMLGHFSPDGTRVVAGPDPFAGDGAVRVFDAKTGKELLALKGPKLLSFMVSFSPDGARILTNPSMRGGDGISRVFDARTGEELMTVKAPASIFRAWFIQDGAHLLVTCNDKQRHVYDGRSRHDSVTLRSPAPMNGHDFSPDGRWIAAGCRDNASRIYDAVSGRLVLSVGGRLAYPHRRVFSPDGSRVVASLHDGTVRVFETTTARELVHLNADGPLREVAFSPDGARLAGLDREGAGRVFNSETGKEAFTLRGPSKFEQMYFSSDSTRIAAVRNSESKEGGIDIFDAVTGKATVTLKPLGRAYSPVFSPDGSRLAVAAADGTHVYAVGTGKEVCVLKGPGLFIPVFSPDGTRIAIAPHGAFGDGALRVFDARTGEEVLAIKGPAPLTGEPSFSPDGTRIVIAPLQVGGDGVARVFDAQNGKELLAFRGPMFFDRVLFSPDGTRIAAGRDASPNDTTIQVFEAPADITAWQKRRRAEMAKDLLDWHADQARDAEAGGQWFAQAFHLTRLIKAQPENGVLHLVRGRAFAAQGLTDRAKEDFTKALTLKESMRLTDYADVHAELGEWNKAAELLAEAERAPRATSDVWGRHAALCVKLGDREGYQAACKAVVERFGKETHPQVVSLLGSICTMTPDAPLDLQPLVTVARKTAQTYPDVGYLRRNHAVLLFRVGGKDKEALAELNEAIRLEGLGGTSVDHLFLAMLQHRSGQAEEAKRSLERAAEIEANAAPHVCYQRLRYERYRREAEQTIEGKPRAPERPGKPPQ